MKMLGAAVLALAATVSLGGCTPEPARSASPMSMAAPQNVQQGVGMSPEDRFVTQRGGSSAGTQSPLATGRDVGGITRTGAGRGTAGTRQNVRLRQDGTGSQSVDRGPGVGAPLPGQPAPPRQ